MELEYLLNNYWCTKEENPKQYYDIKNKLDDNKDFIQSKLGSKLIVNDRFIKLEKVPPKPKQYMGINDFKDILEYNILFIILLYLEDKTKNYQFILSNLIEYIESAASSLKLDHIPNWTLLHHRKCLVNVIKHLSDLNIIKIVEETNTFTEDENAEGLYESTGLSNYYIREFKGDITHYENIEDFVNDEFEDQSAELGDIRRYRVYRHLLYTLVAYSSDLTEAEKDYLKRFRNIIGEEIDKYTFASLEITKNMANIFYNENFRDKGFFPNAKAISDITLLVNAKITSKVDEEKLELNEDETITLPREIMHRIIKDVKSEYKDYFTKNYREMKTEKFISEVVDYMINYDLLRKEKANYIIMPMTFRLNGFMPIEEKTKDQLDIFGGEENEI